MRQTWVYIPLECKQARRLSPIWQIIMQGKLRRDGTTGRVSYGVCHLVSLTCHLSSVSVNMSTVTVSSSFINRNALVLTDCSNPLCYPLLFLGICLFCQDDTPDQGGGEPRWEEMKGNFLPTWWRVWRRRAAFLALNAEMFYAYSRKRTGTH